MVRQMAACNAKVPPSPKPALPVITFPDEITLHLNGDEVHAVHVPPAHTDGDAIVHFRKGNVVHMGDLYFTGMYPFIDLSSGGARWPKCAPPRPPRIWTTSGARDS